MMVRTFKKFLSTNAHFFVGILIGLYVSSLLTDKECVFLKNHDDKGPKRNESVLLNVRAVTRPNNNTSSVRPVKKTKLIRPRYYSTELGIREKLFVGVLSTEDGLNRQILHLNKTLGHLVDKIKFFITAQYKLKAKLNMSGLVGFTDTRRKYRPFQIIKYIGDSFLQDYDYYFLVNDRTYVDARKLKDFVDTISVSRNVYYGSRVTDGSYCNLDAGIIMSNSVVRAMHENLQMCISGVVGDDHSENLGRCVYLSTKIDCQEDKQFASYKIKHFSLGEHLKTLADNPDFNGATTIMPVLESRDFHILNAHFAKQRLIQLHNEDKFLAKDLTESWPPGRRPGSKPLTRFDVPKQTYFNATHVYFPDDFTNVAEHTKNDLEDIDNVLEVIKSKVSLKLEEKLQFRRLINGYRTFDLSRGMDYQMDVGFRDLRTGKEIVKRFEVCKPLGKVEFVQAPYVTENTRVTIFLPVQESETKTALTFIENYAKTVLEHREKVFLMLVLLYQYESSSKGRTDVFYDVKNSSVKLSERFRNDDAKIAWVSIRLPKMDRFVSIDDCSMYNYAVVDLALKKVGLESLILILDPHGEITLDFINRVRMNTISGFQIFNPIPFRQYDPKITETNKLEINKNTGHFDREQYKYVSFYARDYVKARKRAQRTIPIIRSDNDVSKLTDSAGSTKMGIFEMFLKYSDVHCMRATEMGLKIKHIDRSDGCYRKNFFHANKQQLAKLLLKKPFEIGSF